MPSMNRHSKSGITLPNNLNQDDLFAVKPTGERIMRYNGKLIPQSQFNLEQEDLLLKHEISKRGKNKGGIQSNTEDILHSTINDLPRMDGVTVKGTSNYLKIDSKKKGDFVNDCESRTKPIGNSKTKSESRKRDIEEIIAPIKSTHDIGGPSPDISSRFNPRESRNSSHATNRSKKSFESRFDSRVDKKRSYRSDCRDISNDGNDHVDRLKSITYSGDYKLNDGITSRNNKSNYRTDTKRYKSNYKNGSSNHCHSETYKHASNNQSQTPLKSVRNITDTTSAVNNVDIHSPSSPNPPKFTPSYSPSNSTFNLFPTTNSSLTPALPLTPNISSTTNFTPSPLAPIQSDLQLTRSFRCRLPDNRVVDITKSAFHSLDESIFVRDEIINFFLQLALSQTKSMLHSCHIFNSFFYFELDQKDENEDVVYVGTKGWTGSIDIFLKPYVIMPINESMRWFTAILYNLPSLVDTNIDSSNHPIIFILDLSSESLDMQTLKAAERIRNFIISELEQRRNMVIDKSMIEIRSAGVPLCHNVYDYGISLVHYIERFLLSPEHYIRLMLRDNKDGLEEEWDIEKIRNKRVEMKLKLLELESIS